MEQMIIAISILVASFYLLIKSSDYLVSSSSILGRRMGISKFVIGLTLIAVGTSLPELFTAIMGIFASSSGSSFLLGTVIGSNISNILLVFGFLLVISKNFTNKVHLHNVYILIGSTLILILALLLEEIGFIIGMIFIILFVGYIYHSVVHSKKKDIIEEVDEIEDESIKHQKSYIVSFIFIGSLIGLNLAARGVVFSIEALGIIYKIPLEYLTLTTVAFATSLPELVVTYTSAKKGEFDLAVGNIIGSNVSNIFFIIGLSGLFSSLTIGPILFNLVDYIFSGFILMIATVLFVYYVTKKELKKYHGVFLLMLYFIYVLYIFL